MDITINAKKDEIRVSLSDQETWLFESLATRDDLVSRVKNESQSFVRQAGTLDEWLSIHVHDSDGREIARNTGLFDPFGTGVIRS